MTRTTILIPNYNGIKYIDDCLESIALQSEKYQIVIVDNGSCDGSAERIKELASTTFKDRLQLIKLGENTGFCHAVNVGLEFIGKEYKSEFVFLLNNDTTVEADTIANLEKCMDSDKKIFSVQSRILTMKDKNIIDDCGDLYCSLGWAYARGKGESADSYPKRDDVFACCGAAVMYRMELLDEVGMFDDNHFAYLEDIDIGYRARIKGYRNVYEPSSVIYHAGSATSGSRYNKFKIDLSSQNSVYIIYKNMPILQIIINLPFLIAGFAVKTVFFCLKGMGFTYVRGLARGVKKSIEDMKEGHRHKMWFRPKYIPSYVKIQVELWENMVRRVIG